MKLALGALVGSVAVLVQAQTGPGQCAEDFDCQWTYVDQFSNRYDFDFSPLCPTGADNVVADAGGHNFTFKLCGLSNQKCLPQGYTEKFQYGAVVQVWDSAPPCNTSDNSTMCYSAADGMYECCTPPCEVVGVGTPQWAVLDPNNPTTGGVSVTYTGVTSDADSRNQCGFDPITTAPIPRRVTFNLYCKKGLLGKDLIINSINETSTCNYVINASSPVACGCEPTCVLAGIQTRACGPDGCGGFCSPPDLLGECPYANGVQQVCDYDAGTCCRPDCNGRQCGDNGCGTSCGTCGGGETCSAANVCVPNPSYPPQFAIEYATDSGSLAGGFIGGIFSALAVAAAFLFFFRGGREAFDRWRFADSTGGSLLAGKAASAPSLASPAGSASGGYGSGLASSGGGGYGSTSS